MKKNRFFDFYFCDVFLDDTSKRNILDSFKTSNFVKVENYQNYLEVSKYEIKRIHLDNKDADLLKEAKSLEVGSINWYSQISKNLQERLNDYAYRQYYDEQNECVSNIAYNRYIQSLNDDTGEIFDEVEDPNKEKNERLIEIYNKVEIYYKSYFSEDEMFSEDGNLSEDFLNNIRCGFTIKVNSEKYYQALFYLIQDEIEDSLEFINGKFKLNAKAYKEYVLESKKIPESKASIMYRSIARSIKTFKGLLKCNCDKFEHFITLTFADVKEKEKHLRLNNESNYNLKFKYVNDPTNYEECVNALRGALNLIKKNMKKRNLEFYYVGVPEYQKNGNVHFHLLTNKIPDDLLYTIPDWLDYDYITQKYHDGKGVKSWKYGKSEVEEIMYQTKIQNYLSKYMLKSFYNVSTTDFINRLDKQRYYCSSNLIRPEINYYDTYEVDEYYSKFDYLKVDSYFGNVIKKSIYQVKKINDSDVLIDKNSQLKIDDIFE